MDSDELSIEQTEMVVQFQDLTGIDDMNLCRDILTRHQWDLEVAIHEFLREGRLSAVSTPADIRAPQVINDRFLQHIFSAHMPGGRGGGVGPPTGITGFLGYIINYVFQFCYNTISSFISAFISIFRSDEQIVTDPVGDVMKFIRNYTEKYPNHPTFYQGTYAQALNDAKKELKYLLVYLHSDKSNTNDVHTFCSQTLSNSSVIDYINCNMLFWGCDNSSPEGYRVSHSINARNYPIMVVIGPRSNKLGIMGRLEGDCLPEELIRRLRMIVNDNEVWLERARLERLERSMTQSLRQQQDEAYEQSLRADQEKERQKQIEREEKLKIRQAEEAIIQAEQQKKQLIAQQKIELASQVPSEPPINTTETISIVFKLPNGARIERRFLGTNSIKEVYNYIFCHPSSPDSFEITTNFPKRVLCTKDTTQDEITLLDAGLKSREVLFVNDLDA